MDNLPPTLRAHTGYILAVERPPQGGFFVVELLQTERGRFVLKRGDTPEKRDALRHECTVLNSLAEHAPFVPQPVAQAEQDDTGWFLFTYLEGTGMAGAIAEADEQGRHALAAEFGRTLRRLHGWTPALPRSTDWLSEALEKAAAKIATGRVETPLRHQGPWDGAAPRETLAQVRAWRAGTDTDLVFGHGDYCLPNVLHQDGHATGVIDWSAGGYADRRFDLATAQWTLRYNTGTDDYLPAFLAAYGMDVSRADLRMCEALYAML